MKEIDLIPRDIHFLIDWNYRRISVYALIFVSLAVSLIWRVQISSKKSYERMLQKKQAEIGNIESKQKEVNELIEKLKSISKDRAELSKVADLVREYTMARVSWSEFLADLSRVSFSSLWLNRISVEEATKKNRDNEDIRIKRIVMKGRCERLDDLSKLLSFLEEDPLLENVVLYQNEKGRIAERDFYNFFIKGEVSGDR